VRGLGNETGGPVALAAGAVVGANHEQSGELALRAGVGLQRHAGEASDLGEPGLELAKQGGVALCLLARGEGCSRPNSGQVTGSFSAVALSFRVHEPSGIMAR